MPVVARMGQAIHALIAGVVERNTIFSLKPNPTIFICSLRTPVPRMGICRGWVATAVDSAPATVYLLPKLPIGRDGAPVDKQ